MRQWSPVWLPADWPAPPNVYAGVTQRQGGVSRPPYHSLNLGLHVGDDSNAVRENRSRLDLPTGPVWLEQVHGQKVVDAATTDGVPCADASFSRQPNVICAVLTADCLPLLMTDRAGRNVAAVHVGWRGLVAGIIEASLATLAVAPNDLIVWLGPAIGATAYEVGEDVRTVFIESDSIAADCFQPTRQERWLMDIYALARQRLQRQGVASIYGGEYCTFTDPERFFSYRRDGVTGRMASVIWFEE